MRSPRWRAASYTPECLLVTAGEYRGRGFGEVQQLTAADEAAFMLEIPLPHQQRVELMRRPFQRRPVAVDPGPAAQVIGRAGDRADAAVSQASR